MSKVRNATVALMTVLAVIFVVSAVVDGIHGDIVDMRLNLMWSVICIMQVRVELLFDAVKHNHETIGKMIELLGLMCRIEVVEDEE